VLNSTGFGDGAELWPFSGSLVTQNVGKMASKTGFVRYVAAVGKNGIFSMEIMFWLMGLGLQ